MHSMVVYTFFTYINITTVHQYHSATCFPMPNVCSGGSIMKHRSNLFHGMEQSGFISPFTCNTLICKDFIVVGEFAAFKGIF